MSIFPSRPIHYFLQSLFFALSTCLTPSSGVGNDFGMAGKPVALDFTLGACADTNHFRRLEKMGIGAIARLAARSHRLLDNALELVLSGIFHQNSLSASSAWRMLSKVA